MESCHVRVDGQERAFVVKFIISMNMTFFFYLKWMVLCMIKPNQLVLNCLNTLSGIDSCYEDN